MEEQRLFASFINVFVYFITKHWFARFIKTFITKAISNTYTTPLSLFVPSAPPCSPPLCVPFICSRLPLSLHISKEPKNIHISNLANDTNYLAIGISVIREIRSSYHKVQNSKFRVQRIKFVVCV